MPASFKPSGKDSSRLKKGRKNSSKALGEIELWGIHSVSEVLKNRPLLVRQVVFAQRKLSERLQYINDLAVELHVPVLVDPSQLDGISADSAETKHQGVLAHIRMPATLSLDELLAKIQGGNTPLLLALDSIQDPHNLGAMVRSAYAAGASAVIVTKDRSAPLGGTAFKVSAGTLIRMDICQVTNMVTTLQRLKKEGVWVFGAAGEGHASIFQADFSGPACLVIGSEGKGLRPLVREQCDSLVSIPMAADVDSLNASVAAGIILFEVVRQRGGFGEITKQ